MILLTAARSAPASMSIRQSVLYRSYCTASTRFLQRTTIPPSHLCGRHSSHPHLHRGPVKVHLLSDSPHCPLEAQHKAHVHHTAHETSRQCHSLSTTSMVWSGCTTVILPQRLCYSAPPRGHRGPTCEFYRSDTTGCRRDGRKRGAPPGQGFDMPANGLYQYYSLCGVPCLDLEQPANYPSSRSQSLSLFTLLPLSFAYCTCITAQRSSTIP